MSSLFAAMVLSVSLAGGQQKPNCPEYPGQMYIVGRLAAPMPLKHTAVEADVAGMGARVTVRQEFTNESKTPIEAVYKFPLPHDAAVDRMKIRIGSRVIEGKIFKREEAKKVYEEAKQQGKVAALLDQENENVFTQQVANVMPGKKIEVEISYVQLLKFEDGQFEFTFPMVVGPRFLAASTPNPEKLATPTLPAGFRSGQNISLSMTIHGGAAIRDYRSVLHQVKTKPLGENGLQVKLANEKEIPNRDFIFRYQTASDKITESLFTTWDPEKGGYFALVVAPPRNDTKLRTPKEMVFVMDQSGSQSGFPIEKSKELSLKLLDTMKPGDTFNVMGFSNEVNPLWPAPKPFNSETKAEAVAFIKGLYANGGTEMEKAVVASLSPELDPNRVRIVLFNTDGYAGQEPEILRNVQQYRGMSRLFTFGIGNSVNRALIDAMSYEGRGASEVVTLAEKADEAVDRFAKRMESPLLVDVQTKFEGSMVNEVTPKLVPDVFSARPVIVYGRYSKPGHTTLTLSGIAAGVPWSREIEVDLPKTVGDGSAVASLWARAKLSELKSQTYTATAFGKKLNVEAEMTKIALEHRIMSQYTSFVAVDSSVVNNGGKSKSVNVPVEMPDGVTMGIVNASPASLSSTAVYRSAGKASPGGAGGGFGGRGTNQMAVASPAMGGGGFTGKAGEMFSQNGAINLQDKLIESRDKQHGFRVPQSLLDAKGKVQVRILVQKVTQDLLVQLKAKGVRVFSHDGDETIFAELTVDQLKDLAEIKTIRAVGWFREPGSK